MSKLRIVKISAFTIFSIYQKIDSIRYHLGDYERYDDVVDIVKRIHHHNHIEIIKKIIPECYQLEDENGMDYGTYDTYSEALNFAKVS